MTTSIVEADSILAIDLGAAVTRALLFDVVDGQYRYIGSGSAPTTANAPYLDIGVGVLNAAFNLQETIGRTLIERDFLILPSKDNSSGIDRLVVVHSTGPEIRIIAAGLMENFSLQSAQNLAATIPSQIIDHISLGDQRPTVVQLDAIINAEPDLVIFAGGTDNGASRSVIKQAELLLQVCRILPQEKRPHILYAGNHALARKIQDVFSKFTVVSTAPNLRREIKGEDLSPAQETLASMVTEHRIKQIGGMDFLASLCCVPPLPASHAAGRMINFLYRTGDPSKGVLGVNLGQKDVITAAARGGKLCLNVSPFLLREGIEEESIRAAENRILRWLPVEIPPGTVRDYIQQKTLYPESIPVTDQNLAIEQAMGRAALETGMEQIRVNYPDLNETFEPVLAGGSILSQMPTAWQKLLMLLDGLQPEGISTVILDQHDLLPALGAIAETNAVLPIQVLESSAFQNLGTIICPVSPARHGTPVLHIRIEFEKENETRLVIRQGSLTVLPLKNGQKAIIHLEPLHHTRIEPGWQGGVISFKITGGLCGAVIDARGRPIVLPGDPSRRRDLLSKWSLAFDE
jgi:hypothetical protein